MRAAATLVRWLGPWADRAARPEVGAVDEDTLAGDGGAPMRVRVYRPRRAPRSTFLLAAGLHYAGADDARVDRFCRILAAAGHTVVAPFVPDFLALLPTRGAIDDFARAHAAIARWDRSGRSPVVMSLSFGCLLALGLAARVPRGAISRLILFGAYGDLGSALRYAMTGEVDGRPSAPVPRDPLNQPVIFMNLLAHLEPPCADPDAVAAGWRRYVEATWGRPELKARERYTAIAYALAPSVPDAVRDLFLVGIGARPGAVELATPAIARAAAGAAALDVGPFLPLVRAPVDIIHGRDDDVIPYEQATVLAGGLTATTVRVHLTGLYDHSGAGRLTPRTAVRELATMARIIRALS